MCTPLSQLALFATHTALLDYIWTEVDNTEALGWTNHSSMSTATTVKPLLCIYPCYLYTYVSTPEYATFLVRTTIWQMWPHNLFTYTTVNYSPTPGLPFPRKIIGIYPSPPYNSRRNLTSILHIKLYPKAFLPQYFRTTLLAVINGKKSAAGYSFHPTSKASGTLSPSSRSFTNTYTLGSLPQ